MMKTYPLSQSQMGIFLEMMQHPKMTQYNIGYIVPLPLHIDLDRLELALKTIYAARPEWRIRFLMEGNEPRQCVDDTRELEVTRLTLTEEQWETYLKENRKPFDLFNDVLCRFWLIELPERKVLIFDFCHLIMDGMSGALLFLKTDLPLAYEGASLPEMSYGILSWTEEEELLFHTPTYEKDKEYYRQHFQGCEALSLAKNTSAPLGRYIRHDEYLPQQEVTDWCKAHGTAPNLLFMAAYAYTLSVVGREENFVFTTVNHGRTKRQMRQAYGMFVRTVPIRATVNGETKVIDFIQSFRAELTGTIRHGSYPFTHFCRDMQIKPDNNFAYQSGEITEDIIFGGVSYPLQVWDSDTTCGDLSLVVYERDGQYDLRAEASDRLCSTDFLQTVARMVKTVAQQMMTHHEATLSKIALLSPEEQAALIKLGTGEKRDYDTTQTLIDLFREQAMITPHAVAVIDAESQFTYRELDQASDVLACLLIREGIKPGDHVCVELPRRKEFLLAVFGIMKAGAAYVPIDMEYPEERKRFIIEDSEAKLVIDEAWLSNFRVESLELGTVISEEVNNVQWSMFNVQCSTAYIIYTSGSTGKPKGVVVPHRALSHVVQFLADLYRLTPQSRISCHASFAFDTSMEDLYPVLTVGGTVCVVPEEATKDLNLLHRFLTEHRITGGTFTTQLGQLLLQEYPDLSLDYVEITGEKMTVNPPFNGRLLNVYGPTEFTVDATWYELEPGRQYDNIPIGRPLYNQTAYIIDRNRRLLPRGMAGELCLAGIQMATGYWKREELTNELFTDIIVDGKPVKVYRTGDLCRWNEDGQLEYLGRIDQQVKLRGFRIELGEIESQAMKFEGVSQAVATVHDGQLLCLYYTADCDTDEGALKEFLAKSLPDYMVPAAYIQLDELPLTPNGKVDRKRLPKPDMTEEDIVLPATPLEQKLFDITAERLGTDRFGVTANLISLGLSSIAAMRLSIAIHQQTGYNLSVRDILSRPTVRQMVKAIEEGLGTEQVNLADYHVLQEYYPLTENQRGVYIDWEMNRDTTQYNMPHVFRFHHSDANRLADALRKVVDAHSYIKTRFAIRDGEVMQQRRDEEQAQVSLTHLEVEPDTAFFQGRVRPFNPFEGDMYRLEVYTYGNDAWLFKDFHHLISDGLSEEIFYHDLMTLLQGGNIKQEDVTAFDFALYEQELRKSERYIEAQSYFDKLLEGTEAVSYPHSSTLDETERKSDMLIHEITDGNDIRKACRNMGITENAYFQTVLAQVLHRITREDNIMLATISGARQLSGMERMMGMFVRTIPLVSKYTPGETGSIPQTFAQAAQAMHRQGIESVVRDFYPLTEVVERHGLKPQILYAYQGDLYDGVNLSETDEISDMPLMIDTQKLPIELIVWPNGKGGYTLGLSYDTVLYSRRDLEIFVHALANYALHATKEGIRLADIELLNHEEQQELIKLGTGEKRDYDTTKTLIDLFREQAKKTPDAVAVVDKDSQYTYQELDQTSDTLACLLIEGGIKPGDHVCVELPRRKEFLLAVFGIMKAGAAYVPIDMEYPEERKRFIIEDSEAKLVIDETWLKAHSQSQQSTVNVQCPMFNVQCSTAYIIYTSGSTGKPKGVVVPHQALSHLIQFVSEGWELTTESRISCHASFAFDASVENLFAVLTVGGTTFIVPEEATKDLSLLHHFILENRITGGSYIPQIGQLLLQEYPDLSVEYMVVGGDKMMKNPQSKCRLINVYGPTEFTIDATYYELEHGRQYDNIPIGRPLYNQTAYIIDGNKKLLPRGMAGELCLAGIQMATGYWKREELTKKLFTEITVDGKPVKVYRTGDLCRWNEEGQLEYLGRIDQQVKLRGFRIELGEIESQALKFEGIRQAVAAVHDGQLLCLYYVDNEELRINNEELREFLAQSLPDYMVPAAYIQLDKIPLTPNGKVDRKKLPAPDMTSDVEYVAPEGETEQKVAGAFAEVLNLTASVGALDDFFSLGGDSIKSIRLVSRLRSDGVVTQVADVMRLRTVRAIAAAVRHDDNTLIPQETVTGEIDPNPIQLEFLLLNLPKPEHFNQAVALRSQEPVNAVLLRQALEALAVHHDMLRAVVRNGKIIIRDIGEGQLVDLCEPEELHTVDLKNGPIFKASLQHSESGDILLIACHHISCDGVSWRIITEDLNTAYRQLLEGKPVKLPPKTHTFAHYTQALRRYRDSHLLMREKSYWKKVQERMERLGLEGNGKSHGERRTLDVSLGGESIRRLLTTANHAYNTGINDLLVTALCQAYRQLTGQADVVIQMEGHGREPIHEPLMTDRTVGWFTSVYPLAVEGVSGDTRHDIRLVKETFRAVPCKGLGYGILQYIPSVKGDGNLRTDLMPPIGFNYLGQMEENRSGDVLTLAPEIPTGQAVATENASSAPSLDINCVVEGGTFHADMAYDTSVWTDIQAQALADVFVTRLQAIADHTSEVTLTEPTASDIGAEGWTDGQFQAITDRFAARGEHLQRIYPLTPMQEAMLLEYLKDTGTTAYRLVSRYAVDTLPTEQALRNTMDWLAERHETLRTAIIYDGVQEPCQAIVDRRLPIAFIDLTEEQDMDEAAARIHRELQHRPISLQDDPLFSLTCLKTSDSSCQLIFHEHHIITDGWSLPIYMGDFLNRLASDLQGRQLAATPIEHGRHERFVRSLHDKDMATGLAYWKEQLQGYETRAAIPAYRKPADQEARETSPYINIELDKGLTAMLHQLAAKAQCTMNTVMELAWGLTLQACCRTDDAVFAKVVSGRSGTDMRTDDIVGLFINSMPVRVRTEDGQTIAEALRRLQAQAAESAEWDFCPLSRIQAQTDLGQALFQSTMAFENYPIPQGMDEMLEQWNFRPVQTEEEPFNELSIAIGQHGGDRLGITIAYDSSLYPQEEIRTVADTFTCILQSMAEQPDVRAKDIQLVTEEEQAALIRIGTGERIEYDSSETFVSLFRKQAMLYPDATAVVDEDSSITYAELDRRSDILATALIEAGVKQDSIVAVMLPRRKEFLLAVMGIFKAGGAYLPLDSEYPAERLQYMMDDAEAGVLITTSFLDQIDFNSDCPAVDNCKPESLAYMIYTSGSTGKPKGVMVEHRNLRALMEWRRKMLHLTQTDRCAEHASFCFDASVDDLMIPLTAGAQVHILSETLRHDLEGMNRYIRDAGITGMTLSTQLAMELINTFDDLPLGYIMAGGEALQPTRRTSVRIINGYGPTEFTVCASYHIVDQERHYDTVPIGQPVPGSHLFIVDPNGRLVPKGMAGELCLAGKQMARGYWKQEELTREKFVNCPFAEGERMYRTGDLCRWNEERQLEYLGRIDQQVKLRGFRIELGEIESQALKFGGISQAVATVHDGQLLCLYYVDNEELRINNEELREYLSKSLPDYMVPAAYIHLDELPLTLNGKVDRKELPVPDMSSDIQYVAPEGETEDKVATAFAEVLNLTSPVGALDDFFSLGGDSIKAIRLVSRLRSDGVVTQVADVMRLRTVRAIAAAVRHDDNTLIPQETVTGEIDSNPIQQAFFQWNLPKPEHFNQAVALRSLEPVNAVLLRQALEALAVHHDMLRAVVRDGKIIIRDIGEGQLVGLCEPEELHTIDLKSGPIFKASLQHSESGDILLIACHHISCDGVSWRIITEDLNTAYRQLLESKPVKLPPKTHSFAHYTQALRRYRDSHLLMREKPYWKKVQERMESLGLTGSGRPFGERKTLEVSFGGEVLRQLLTTANRAYNTGINDLLVTALCQAYRQLTGQADVAIQMEGHGREPIHEPLMTDRTVGWFTSVYPLAVEGISGDTRHDIRLVKETFRAVPGKGLGYGILQYIPSVKGDGNLRTDLMPPISFNYLGQMEENRGGDVLTLAPEIPTGQTVATENASLATSLDINCVVEGGTFHADMTYDTAIWTKEQAQALADAFVTRLQTIAEHTSEVTRTEPTASDIGAEGWTDEQFQIVKEKFEARGEHIERIYPLTLTQKFSLHEIISDPEVPVLMEASRCTLGIAPTREQMEYVTRQLANLHEVLRTAIIYQEVNTPMQAIIKGRQIPLEYIDMSGMSQDARDMQLKELVSREAKRCMNLEDEPLFRLVCAKTSESDCELFFTMQHIITDRWSGTVLIHDFIQLMKEALSGQRKEHEGTKGVFEAYVGYVNQACETTEESYWSRFTEGYSTKPVFPLQNNDMLSVSNKVKEKTVAPITLDKEETACIRQLCKQNGVTLNTIFELSWGLLLQRYNHTDDIIFMRTTSGRDHDIPGIDHSVGMFILHMPVRLKTTPSDAPRILLRKLMRQAADTKRHEHELASAYSEVPVLAELSKQTLPIIVVLNFTNNNINTNDDHWGDFEGISTFGNEPDFYLYVHADDTFELLLDYNTSIYPAKDMTGLLAELRDIIRIICEYPDEELCNLGLDMKQDYHI